MKSAAKGMNFMNEREIRTKLSKISQLIKDDQKNLVAKYITSKLTIKRRTYLSETLSLQEIKL